MRLLPLLAALVVGAATASATGTERIVTSPGKVLALARSEFTVAFLSGPYKGHCGPHVELWNLVSGGVYKLGRHTDDFCNEGASTGAGIAAIAVAGNRALWLSYAGGNTRDWLLYTATTTSPAERQLEFESVDVESTKDPIVLGVASGSIMPYSVGSTVKALAPSGKLLYTWHAPGRVTNTTAYGQQVAAFVEGGHCFVLSPAGAVQQTYDFKPGAVQEFALGGNGLVVQLPGGKIELHKGTSVKTVMLPAAARMLDYAESIILYKLGPEIRARRLSGKDAQLRNVSLATLEHNGFSYAFGKNVYSLAMVTVQSRINRG